MLRIIVVCTAFTLSVAAGIAYAEPKFGICRTQLEADVRTRFQQKITSIDFTITTNKGGRDMGHKSTALVYTDGCPGYHVYDLFATEHDCKSRAHYGMPPNYIRYRTSSGDY